MKTARLTMREAKEAFRSLRRGQSEKGSRSESKKAIKRAKAALKDSEGSGPRALRNIRSMQVIKEPLPSGWASPNKGARDDDIPAAAKIAARKKKRRGLRKERQAKGETGSSPKTGARERPSRKHPSARHEPGPLKIAFDGVDARLATALHNHFATRAAPRGVALVSLDDAPAPDIAIHNYAFAPEGPQSANARLNIYLESHEAEGADRLRAGNLRIANAAADAHGFVVQTATLISRYNPELVLSPDGLSDAGAALIASAIVQVAADNNALPPSFSPAAIEADDLLAARKLAETPLDLLSKLTWDSTKPPKIVASRVSPEVVEAFARGNLMLPGREEPIPFGENIDWSLHLDNKKQVGSFYGLEFLSPVLSYWYAKANGGESEKLEAVDQCLKDAGFTASSLLARAGAVLADFASSCPSAGRPEMWEKSAAVSRAGVQLLFLLCCRSAAKRRIRFDSQMCTSVFLSLLETLEYLRGPGLAPVASLEGLKHLSFVSNLALPLRRLPYGKNLLQECFVNISQLQLDPGLTNDGVWYRGTFEEHCEVLWAAVGLIVATRGIKVPAAASLTPALDKMASFVESMLRAAKLPPPIDRVALTGQGKLVDSARKIAPGGSGGKPASTTHVFPRAGYFVSHSTADHGVRSSQLAIHANEGSQRLRQLGRIGMGFCRGESELIIGGGASGKIPAAARAASATDLASGNEYRVNGKSYSAAESSSSEALCLEHHWEGRGWAAAMIACRAHTNALIRRTAIHLKPVHAFIMVDQLESVDGSELGFEQFWHLSPDLQDAGGLVFAHPSGGYFAAGFDALERFPVSVERGSEENPIGWTLSKEREPTPHLYLRRTLESARTLAVSAFQWTENPVSLEVSKAALEKDGWSIRVAGQQFDVRFARDGLILQRLERDS